eukprot:gnl/MRDRNA2_/MRDRNA2_15634_c0_seq1.p1 gnl/MRDRNA2_/MRDRNA2_15634_c0~~gnl/MRDRNA2_/MRDRNA2_15634_c0_seq1.p1  ORF type:complete len:412 (+),score=75.36 gnl/MRDRNA2_/MRDRNA2_15634_c0_seq1:184-1419(+)
MPVGPSSKPAKSASRIAFIRCCIFTPPLVFGSGTLLYLYVGFFSQPPGDVTSTKGPTVEVSQAAINVEVEGVATRTQSHAHAIGGIDIEADADAADENSHEDEVGESEIRAETEKKKKIRPDLKVETELYLGRLPQVLYELGLQTFGSHDKLARFVENTRPEEVLNADGIEIKLVSQKADNAIERLKGDYARAIGSGYRLETVTETDGAIVDIGGNLGDVAVAAAKRHPTLQIITLEPIPSTYFYLRWNLFLNNVPLLQEKDLGVVGKHGVLPLNVACTIDGRDTEIRYSTSLTMDAVTNWNEDNQNEKDWARGVVPSLILPDFLSAHNVGPVRLLKMDCEGCEFYLIPEFPDFFANKTKVQRFVAEIHRNLFDPALKQKTVGATISLEKAAALDEVMEKRGCKKKKIYNC